MTAAVTRNAPVAAITGAPVLSEIAQMRAVPPAESARQAGDLARRVTHSLHALEGDTS